MMCQECNERPATLHFKKIINGQKNELHICEKCAREKGEDIPGTNSFSIHQLLSGLLNFNQPVSNEQTSQIYRLQQQTCEKCNMSYEQFVHTGRIGCAHCYDTFREKLDPLLKRVHSGNSVHSGKIPKRVGSSLKIKKEIEHFKSKLQEHIIKEEFEQAAMVRDQIRSLEKKLSNGEEE